MIVSRPIRGGIGQQILDVLYWYSDSIEQGYTIDQFDVNIGHEYSVTNDHISHNFIPKIFTTGTVNFAPVYGVDKGHSWKVENFALIAKHIDKTRKFFIPIYRFDPTLYNEHITFVHVRATDRQFLSAVEYKKVIESFDDMPYIIGDNHDLIEKAYLGFARKQPSALSDWKRLYMSHECDCFCGLTSFVIAAGLLNPTLIVKTVNSISDQNIYYPPFMEDCYNIFANQLNNFRWVQR